jgi:biotin carboxyl carrier protein
MKHYTVKVNGVSYQVEVEEAGSAAPAPVAAAPAPVAAAPAPGAAVTAPVAPAPAPGPGTARGDRARRGTIIEVTVQLGESVTRGQVLCILEAMKMENEIVAPRDGTIAAVSVTKGASVNAGDPMISLA